jgi:hypothetical protein
MSESIRHGVWKLYATYVLVCVYRHVEREKYAREEF